MDIPKEHVIQCLFPGVNALFVKGRVNVQMIKAFNQLYALYITFPFAYIMETMWKQTSVYCIVCVKECITDNLVGNVDINQDVLWPLFSSNIALLQAKYDTNLRKLYSHFKIMWNKQSLLWNITIVFLFTLLSLESALSNPH